MTSGACTADSIVLLSDGIVHDGAAVLDLARAASQAAGAPPDACMPPVHCVGFFAKDRGTQGPAFLEALAKESGGTFQEFNPSQACVYVDGELRPFDTDLETAEDRAERMWVEARLRSERSLAVRTGKHPSFQPITLSTGTPTGIRGFPHVTRLFHAIPFQEWHGMSTPQVESL
jgi:hypothetical protein